MYRKCLFVAYNFLYYISREKIALAVSLIHSYMLQENNQVPWAGHCNSEISMNSTNDPKRDILQSNVYPYHLPLCRDIVQV